MLLVWMLILWMLYQQHHHRREIAVYQRISNELLRMLEEVLKQ